MGLRVSGEDEQMGLDLSQHNEAGYALYGVGGTHAMSEPIRCGVAFFLPNWVDLSAKA